MMRQFQFFLLIAAVDALKLNYGNREEDNVCSQSSEDQVKPWRARAVCEEDEVELLGRYLSVSESYTEALELEEMERKKGKGKKRKGKRGRKNSQGTGNKGKEDAGDATVTTPVSVGTQVFQGKFCASGAKSGGSPISTSVYGYKKKDANTTDHILRVSTATSSLCYTNTCSGRCDQVDPSVKFECAAGAGESKTDKAKWSSVKASWFIAENCKKSSETKTDAKTKKETISSLDSYYTYTAAQVKTLNSGSQGRYCWGMGGRTGIDTNNEWNNADIAKARKAAGKTEYYYSYSSSQLLPECPR